MYVANTAELQLYASGRTTGIVIDSGATMTHIVPIVEGRMNVDAVEKTNLGGRDVTSHMKQLFCGGSSGQHAIAISLDTARDIKHQCAYRVVLQKCHENGKKWLKQ